MDAEEVYFHLCVLDDSIVCNFVFTDFVMYAPHDWFVLYAFTVACSRKKDLFFEWMLRSFIFILVKLMVLSSVISFADYVMYVLSIFTLACPTKKDLFYEWMLRNFIFIHE